MDQERTWSTELSTSFSDADIDAASEGRDLWPRVELTLTSPDAERELELVFDEVVDVLVEYAACAVLDADDGTRSLAVPANWKYRSESDGQERGEGAVIYRPVGDGMVALDVVALTGDVKPDGGRGRFDEDVQLDSTLPIGAVPVSAWEQLESLYGLGQEALARYREHGSDPAELPRDLPRLVRDVERALGADDGDAVGFDTSLESLDRLWDPTADTVGPIESEGLREHALVHDRIEELVAERISTHALERAADLYHGLLTVAGEPFAQRTLSALERHPDEKAVPGLLMRLWNDDPDTAPGALSVLGALLETHDEFTENDRGHDRAKVVDEIVDRVEGSEHSEIRTAAIETLSEAGLVGREDVRDAIETARDDPNDGVRAAAEAALEAEER